MQACARGIAKDIVLATRQLSKAPGFTAVAVLSLGLGIGANTAIFSALRAVLLRTLPVQDAEDLRLVNWTGRNPRHASYTGPGTARTASGFTVGTSFSYPGYLVLREGASGLSDLFAFTSKGVTVIGHGEPRFTEALLVTGNYFSGYGVRPLLGRAIQPEDDRPGAALVAVVTYRWWERQCGRDPGVVGRPVSVSRNTATVIGVLPQGYVGPMPGDEAEIYLPLSAQTRIWPAQPLQADRWSLQLMGRLAPGATDAQAQASLSLAFRHVLEQSKSEIEHGGIVLEDGSRGQLILRRKLARPFLALTAAVAVVLLVACANLAGLLLARGAARQHELAVRAAMGAGRWRLVRQSLVESLLLSLFGGGLGLLIAAWGQPVLRGFVGPFYGEEGRFDVRLDGHVLTFSLVASVTTALLFGALPAIRSARVDPAKALRQRSAIGAPRLLWGRGLVAIQVGLSVLLVMGAGLMIRTFGNLARVAPGFEVGDVLLFRIRPGDAGYRSEDYAAVYDRVRSAIAAIPGVRAVSHSAFALLSGSSSSTNVEFPGSRGESSRKENTEYLAVGEDFFGTLGLPLLVGRGIDATDSATGRRVAVVNETLARRHYPGLNPIGRTFVFPDPTPHGVEIVGVARDAKYNRMRADAAPLIYLPQRQAATRAVTFAVRSPLPPSSLLPELRRAVAGVDPRLPLFSISTQRDLVERSIAPERLFAELGGAFAALAMLLSCIGLYGLMAYDVTRRTREIGLRMALGATRHGVAAPIAREALLLVGAGFCAGLPAALALARLVESQLYGVAPADPATIAAGGMLLAVVTVASAWIPARRAARVDPMTALRCD